MAIKSATVFVVKEGDVLEQINKFLEECKIKDTSVINVETNIQKDIYTIWYRDRENQVKSITGAKCPTCEGRKP